MTNSSYQRVRDDTIASRKWVAGVLALAVALFLVAGVVNVARREAQRGIHLFVTAHPDDELQGWSSLTNDPAVYTVFLTLTRGENTARCEPEAVAEHLAQQRLGETPIPTDPVGRGTPHCGAARVAAWHAMLDASAKSNLSTQLGESVQHWETVSSGERMEIWLGTQGARIVLNQGDGELDVAKAKAGIFASLALLGEELDLAPLVLTTAAYHNDPDAGAPYSSPASLVYPHPDHAALTEAGLQLAGRFQEGAWIVTHPFDPRATHILSINEGEYARMMGLQDRQDGLWQAWRTAVRGLHIRPGQPMRGVVPTFPYTNPEPDMTSTGSSPLGGFTRLGIYQQEFGWLAFPDPWVPGEFALAGSDALFPRRNVYVHVPGDHR